MGVEQTKPSLASARVCVIAASLLWSTGGGFIKLFSADTASGLNMPALSALQIACMRVLCAGLVLAPLLRRGDFSFHPMMIFTAVCFALMNATFITAMANGSVGNAILLQYTAPMWVYFVSVRFLGERAD